VTGAVGRGLNPVEVGRVLIPLSGIAIRLAKINTVKHGEVKYFRKNLPCIVTFIKLQGLLVNNRDFGSAIR
jgi:hypothetical protein